MKNEKNLKICKVIFSFSFLIFLFLAPANFVWADSNPWGSSNPYGSSQPGGGNSIGNFISSSDFVALATNIANWIFTIALPIAVIMIIWSGILFMTAGGKEDKVATARKALTWSIVGLVVILLAKSFPSIISNLIGADTGNLTSNDIVNIFDRAANYLFTFTLILAVIVFIWNGILFMASGGQEQKITTARKALTWAIVGVAIAIASKGIIMIVISFLNR